MRNQSALTPRDLAVLHSIVQAYIDTGEPVASRTIARRYGENLSSASIRNIMADLYEGGYLTQPHTSAGRLPTEKAFRSYVQSLAVRKVLSEELDRLRGELSSVDTVQGRVERSSFMLMEMTQGFGIAAAFPASYQTLGQVDLLTLADRRVLMVLVTGDHVVRNRVVALNEAISQDELSTLRNYLNRNFSGWVLSDVQQELDRRLRQESAAYDEILRRLQLLREKGLLEIGLAPEVHTEGASNLVGLDLRLTGEKLRELFQALEQKKKILLLLERFLEQPTEQVNVQIGLSEVHPSMGELSLIGISMPLPHGHAGKVAVLGPMRMDYERVISAVLHVGRALQSVA